MKEVLFRRMCVGILVLTLGSGMQARVPRTQVAQGASAHALPQLPMVDHFRLKSTTLSTFWKKDMYVEAGVVRPLDAKPEERLPVVYNVHGFGGSHQVAWRVGPRLQEDMKSGASPRMIYVFLNAQFEHGHHVFADSRFNGPWGTALTTEFIPALEQHFSAVGEPWARFLTGHSSGGWSTLWLQVTYPEVFGGCWSTAPDASDFRDFTGIDIYSNKNAYLDSKGEPIMLMRKNGVFVGSIKQYVEMERAEEPVGGQFYSFNAVFSERSADGRPKQLFDWKTGVIDPTVAESWKRYDIRLVLHQHWKTLGPALAGKLHIYVGTLDTFRLEGPLRLLKAELDALGSDADILFVEGRDHFNLFQPEPKAWPKGMMERIHREMYSAYLKRLGRKAA